MCIVAGDLSDEQHCKDVVQETVQQLGSLQVLVNNVAQQLSAARTRSILQQNS